MKKSLLFLLLLMAGMNAFAQNPTIVTPATNCIVIRNFNTSDEGFSSPSIYGGGDDVAFDWSLSAGAEIESSGLTVRSGSLISPVYLQGSAGAATIGFTYSAPPGAEYRIRIISGIISSPVEVLANTANGPVYTPLPSTSGTICLLLSDLDLTAGRMIRFEFTFRLNQPGNIQFDNLSMAAEQLPLPVTFEGFVARKNTDGSLKLLWNVGEEVNVTGYYLESSTDGTHFTTSTYLPALGKSIYAADYPGPLKGTTFFRVRNIDMDGSSKYTPVIRVYAKESTESFMQVYPMPATDMITVQHPAYLSSAVLSVVSLEGRVLQQRTVMSNTYQTQLNIQTLPRGIYILKLQPSDGMVQSSKLIKN